MHYVILSVAKNPPAQRSDSRRAKSGIRGVNHGDMNDRCAVERFARRPFASLRVTRLLEQH